MKLSSLGRTLGRNADRAKLAVVEEMWTRLKRSGNVLDSAAITAAAGAFAAAGSMQQATRLFHGMDELGLTPGVQM